MEDFVATYKAALPNTPPTRMYFDVEFRDGNGIARPYGINPVFMLHWLASNPTRWNQIIPGLANSAANLYDNVNELCGWPDDITDGIDPTKTAEDIVNRSFMAWWCPLANSTLDRVLKHCVYDVVLHPTTGWPNLKVTTTASRG